jgi:uncharacterized membrane protein required for colicin V production
MIVDLLIVVLMVAGLVLGLFRGAIRQLFAIGGWLVTFLLAAFLTRPAGNWLAGELDQYSLAYAYMLTFGLLFFVGYAAVLIFAQVSGTSMTISRREWLENLLGATFGVTIGLLLATAGLIVLDSYYTLPDPAPTDQIALLTELYTASLDSTLATVLRDTLVPLLGALIGPFLPAELGAVFS